MLALQRRAGNAAVSALLAGKAKTTDDTKLDHIEAAIKEVKKNDPDIDKVEKGLKDTKAAGVPVDLEGEAQKPPPSLLEVVKTGFGPGAVAPKAAVAPKGKVAEKSPLGKGAQTPKKPGGTGGKGGKSAVSKAKADGAGGKGEKDAAGGAPGVGAAVSPEAALGGGKELEPPVKPEPMQPEDDPGFVAVTGKTAKYAKAKGSHPPASSKAKEAQGAAAAPAEDIDGQAKAAKADEMAAQQPGSFDKKAFIASVKQAIEAKSPKTLKQADDFKKSGKAGEVQGQIKGLVTEGKGESEKDIAEATDAPPDTSKAVPKQVTPMGAEDPGKAAKVATAAAVPKAAPPEQTNLAKGKHDVENEMADADVDEEQLAKSNEPEFQDALSSKKEAAEHADTAPKEFRQEEKKTLEQTAKTADADTAEAMAGMHSSKAAALSKVVGGKDSAKTKDEQKRSEVTAKIQSIYDATEADVKKTLDGIDPKVEAAFGAGEKAARSRFEAFVAAKMSAYKKDRYGGWLGGLKWAKDKLLGMPSKVNDFFEAGRELYLKEMDKVISKVADIVGQDLNAAKARIAKGRQEIAAYVKKLPAELKKVGKEAASDIGDQFEQLESDVNSKQEGLVDSLASKYVEARKGIDERVEQLQAENKGLVDKAISAVKAVINTIRQLKDMLLGVLAKAANVIGKIIKDPIGFLSNLIAGVKGGILKFKDNIVEHLRKGLMGWLFGQLGDAGIELPDSFDLKGIVQLLARLFGLTWANIRKRLVKGMGEKVVSRVEKGVDIFVTLATEGPAGLWQTIVEKIGDIKEMIFSKVKEFVETRIIIAGVTWLIGLLNPAAAFIKACKLIYDVVMFFVQNASRIGRLVNTILDSVGAIAGGAIGGVVNKIEQVLSQMLPIIIGFLASVLGLGGIGKKMRGIVQSLKKPVNKAVDWVVKKGMKLAKPLLTKLAKAEGWVKGKAASAKAWAKGKVEKGKAWVKGKAEAGRDRLGKRDGEDVRQQAKTEIAAKTTAPFDSLPMLQAEVRKVRQALRPRGLKDLYVKEAGGRPGTYEIVAVASPPQTVDQAEVKSSGPTIAVGDQIQVKSRNKWNLATVTEFVAGSHVGYTGETLQGRISGRLSANGLGRTWRKYNPAMGYKSDEAFDAIKDLSAWASFPDARQVLNYRHHGTYSNPPGKQWHHIHEQSANGPNSVANLALSTSGQNADFNTWYGRSQPGTGGLTVRQFLKGQAAEAQREWGLKCIRLHGLSIAMKDLGRGPFQEIV